MAQTKPTNSRLLTYTVLDSKDDFDEKLESSYKAVQRIITGLSEREANDALQTHAYKGQNQHDEIQLGFFFNILIDPKAASKCYRDMSLVSKDGLNKTMTTTNQVLYEKWTKLLDTPRSQLLWIIKEMVKNGVTGVDMVIYSVIRQIAGGDVSPKNVWLAETVLDILVDNKPWLDKFPILMTMALYSYLRIIVDHNNPQFATLRQREVDFCIGLLREKWSDCIGIGRDLVRLLQDVARIPEFEIFWKEILHTPHTIAPNFKGLAQLMCMRTSKKYFIIRLTPDMENKLGFLTTKVKFGQHKRYQDWFQKQYLSTPESQSLRCDLIRYICAVIHPSNDILCSDIIPRWAVIGWLLTTCTTNVVASNAKLALFYDWMFYQPDKDSIMNIEPGILVMYHSMRPHPAITATLLDFMCRIMPNFYPPLTPRVKEGMYTSLRAITEKRVLQSLSPLFDNPKLDRELRTMVRANFAEFCSTDVKLECGDQKSELQPSMFSMPGDSVMDNDLGTNDTGNSMEIPAEFSDEEEEIIISTPRSNNITSGKMKNPDSFKPIKEEKFVPVDLSDYLDQLDGDIRSCVVDLQKESDPEAQCEIMDRLMQTVTQEEDFDGDTASPLAMCLCQILHSHFSHSLYPQDADDDSIEESIGTSLFVTFRFVCQMHEEDPNRQPLLLLLEEMYTKQRRIGYNFLYFLKVSKIQTEGKMAPYKDLCKNMEKDIGACLMADLTLCSEDDLALFIFLIPDVYTQFSSFAVGNGSLLHLIVSVIDGTQLQDLLCEILRGHLIMFRKDSFLSVLNASLEWETIEQYFLWQLIAAHNIPVEHIMPILPKLDFTNHAEALSSIMIQLKQDCPTTDLLRPLLCRECKKSDYFTVSILKYWAQEYEDKLADLLHAQLTRPAQGTPNRKRHRNQPLTGKKEKDHPTVEQILAHLEHMRQCCRNISFLTHEQMQQALQQVQATILDSQKHRYSDLLALAEDFEDIKTTRVLRNVASRRAASASSTNTANTGAAGGSSKKNNKLKADDSSDQSSSSEDDDIIKPKHKRYKKAVVDEDD